MAKIRAIIKRTDEAFGHMTNISPRLENLQKLVGGYIEAVTIRPGLVILCDEEGRLKGKEENIEIPKMGIDFVGTVLFVGVDGEEFCDVPEADFLLWNFFGIVRYSRADRKHNVWNCQGCGHLEQFEADGPYENGWNICPVCGGTILTPGNGIT